MNNKIIHTTDDTFEINILKADRVILVDFWAKWCGPCKMISLILDDIAEEYQEKLIIAKIDIDQNPRTASNYNIQSIPTLLLFKNSEVIAKKVGVLAKSQLKEFLDEKLT